nr:hypothetical protein [Aetokthonos hydrillicola CCALA 1050]
IEGRILRLIDYLRSSHYLIVLDHLDSILSKNQNDSTDCRFQEYDVLWQRIGELEHQSTIILTSREKSKKIELLEGKSLPVRSLKLCGLKDAEGRAIFEEKGFFCETHSEWKSIIEYYGGNPLFLKIVSSVVQNLFDSNLDKFIKYWKQDAIIFDDIRDIFNCQFDCLSDLEQSVMYWLAIYQQPVSLQELRDDLFLLRNKHKLLDALMSLQRRCLIDKVVADNNQVHILKITLQPILAKFVLERFIEKICHEILVEEMPCLVMSHPLVKAQNKDSIARDQEFPILLSIAERLLTLSQSYRQIECKLNRMLLKINEKFYTLSGYGLENLFNISSQLNITLSGANFSRLTVVQNEIPDANKLKLAQAGASKSRETVVVTT